MKKILLSLLSLTSVFAVNSSPLDDLANAIESLGCYDVVFGMEVNQEVMYGGGEYRVDGDKYRISMIGREMMGEGDLRYTVDHNEKEVVIETLDSDADSVSLVIINPTTAFTKLGEYYDMDILSTDRKTDKKSIFLELTPKSTGGALKRALLELDRATNLPLSIAYVGDEELIKIIIADITSSDVGVTISYPKDYDIIDIR